MERFWQRWALQTNFGFSEALITLAIAMDFATDPTGTATNVTADGALALEVQAIMERKKKRSRAKEAGKTRLLFLIAIFA